MKPQSWCKLVIFTSYMGRSRIAALDRTCATFHTFELTNERTPIKYFVFA